MKHKQQLKTETGHFYSALTQRPSFSVSELTVHNV